MEVREKSKRLDEILGGYGSVLVAFSGGVDSTFLLARAMQVLSGRVVAATAVSQMHPEVQGAREVAAELGAELVAVRFNLLDDPVFRMNPVDRCYLCKKALFSSLLDESKRLGLEAVMEGSNSDDTGEFRPGRRAVFELGIRTPLEAAGLTKKEIRYLSEEMGLSTARAPSGTCLATRFPYGAELDEATLASVGRAEELVRGKVLGAVRVRVMPGGASVEVEPKYIQGLLDDGDWEFIQRELFQMGFSNAKLDPRGYRSGTMDENLSTTERNRALRGEE